MLRSAQLCSGLLLLWHGIRSHLTPQRTPAERKTARRRERGQFGGQRVTQTDREWERDGFKDSKPSCPVYLCIVFTLTFALHMCMCMRLHFWSRYYIISLSPREHWALCEFIKDTHCRLPSKAQSEFQWPDNTQGQREGVCESEQREWERMEKRECITPV